MGHLLAGWWAAIWPNLAASLIWAAPAFTTHHVLIRRHITRTLTPAGRPTDATP
jgi:hypothetical protein